MSAPQPRARRAPRAASPRRVARLAAGLLLALVVPACATAPATRAAATDGAEAAGDQASGPRRPLAALAGQRVLLLPVQRADSAATGLTAAAVDAELAFALAERGLGATWTTADAVRGLARRNAAYAADPGALAVAGVRRAGDPVAEPLASQLRALAALADARFVVVPEAVLRTGGDGDARLALSLFAADVRAQQVLFAGMTPAVPLADTAPAGRAAAIAARFADLIAAPPAP